MFDDVQLLFDDVPWTRGPVALAAAEGVSCQGDAAELYAAVYIDDLGVIGFVRNLSPSAVQ